MKKISGIYKILNTSKLTEDNVRQIRFLYKTTKTSCGKLGKIFNVSRAVISKVINYKLWKHVED
mgnify:CR=1 FL=1